MIQMFDFEVCLESVKWNWKFDETTIVWLFWCFFPYSFWYLMFWGWNWSWFSEF